MSKISLKYRLFFAASFAVVMVFCVGCKSQKEAVVSKVSFPETIENTDLSRIAQNKQMAVDNAFLEGMKRMLMEDYSAALEIFFEVLKMDNRHASANFQIARIRYLQNQMSDAEIYAERAFRLSQDNKFFVELLADIYSKNHKFSQAISTYQRLIKLDPQNEDDYLLEMANIQVMNRKPNEAIAILDTIEKRRGVSRELSTQKIAIFALLEREDNIGRELQKLVDHFPDDVEILNAMAEFLMNTRRADEALKIFDKILTLDPENPTALAITAAFLQGERRYEEARERYRKVVAMQPALYSVWESLLLCDLILVDSVGLMRDAEQAIELFPEQPYVYFMLGTAYNLQKDYETAMQYYEQASQLEVSNFYLLVQIYSQLGDVYHHLKRYEKSEENFRKALRIEPENVSVLNNFAYMLSLRGENLEEAEKMARFVAQKNPTEPTYLDTFAWVLYKRGKYAEAQSVMELALRYSEEDEPTLLEHYGDILWKNGEKERAVEFWKKAQSIEDTDVSEFLNEKIQTETLIEN